MNATLDQMTAMLNNCEDNSPFSPQNERAYQAWRVAKLRYREELDPARVFDLDQHGRLPGAMLESLQKQVAAYNFVVIESRAGLDKPQLLALNRQFGLHELDFSPGADADKVTSLQVVSDADSRAQYIPYTSRAMNWHTDGYYNPHGRRIGAFVLYCVNQAGRGGGNYLFDHEMMYLLIRDRAPDLLEALMQDDMMRIPANVQSGRIVRAEESGPVFSVLPMSCALNMRYTSRPHNIVWKTDLRSDRALNLVRECLMDSNAMVEIRLHQRQGIVCNNILHGRQAFNDQDGLPARLIYRARYYDSIDFDKGLGRESGT